MPGAALDGGLGVNIDAILLGHALHMALVAGVNKGSKIFGPNVHPVELPEHQHK